MSASTQSLYPLYAAFEGFLSTMGKSVGTLNPIGLKLLVAVSTMILLWQTFVILIEGGGGRKIMANTFYIMALSSFAGMMIERMPMISDVLITSTDTVANSVVDTRYMANGHSKTAQLAVNTFAPLLRAAERIMELEASANVPKPKTDPTAPVNCDETAANPDGYYNPCLNEDGKIDVTKESSSIGFSMGLVPVIGYVLSLLVMWMLSWFLKILAMGTLIIAGCVAMGHILISQVLVQVALVIAPIMIPFMVWDSASFLFDGWLKFFIKALFHKIVGVIILATMGAGIMAGVDAFNSAAAQSSMGAGLSFTVVGSAIMVGLGILTLMLASQIPNIADGLLSGVSRSGVSFSSKGPSAGKTKPKDTDTSKGKGDSDKTLPASGGKKGGGADASANGLPKNQGVSKKSNATVSGDFKPRASKEGASTAEFTKKGD